MNVVEYCVSFSLAQKLKLLGFRRDCRYHYNLKNICILDNYPAEDFNEDGYGNFFISAPTLDQVHRWLREEKGIALNIIAHDGGQYHWSEIFLPNFKGKSYDWYNYHEHPLEETYETALGNGIEWATTQLLKELD